MLWVNLICVWNSLRKFRYIQPIKKLKDSQYANAYHDAWTAIYKNYQQRINALP